nr:MAG TPA: hypothetical protein [Caudoviricetes sp.]
MFNSYYGLSQNFSSLFTRIRFVNKFRKPSLIKGTIFCIVLVHPYTRLV